jgi:hypothetical protein
MKLRITLTRDGRGSTVIDAETGYEFGRLTAIDVRAAMGEATAVTLTMLAEVEVEAEVDQLTTRETIP